MRKPYFINKKLLSSVCLHKNLLGILAVGFNELDQAVLVTLYASGGCLNDHIKRVQNLKTEDFLKVYLKPFASGLKFLMSMRIVHRDLTGRNILIRYDSPNDITKFVLQVIRILIRPLNSLMFNILKFQRLRILKWRHLFQLLG